MDGRLWALAGALLVVGVLALVLAALLGAERSRSRRALEAASAERHALEARVEELSVESAHPPGASEDSADWVITWGDEPDDRVPARAVSDRLVLSTAFGEPLVKVLALGHGLRRALSPESRNRIGFEIRRETRRSRKVRRREMREAWKQMRAQQATQQTEDGAGPADGREDVA